MERVRARGDEEEAISDTKAQQEKEYREQREGELLHLSRDTETLTYRGKKMFKPYRKRICTC